MTVIVSRITDAGLTALAKAQAYGPALTPARLATGTGIYTVTGLELAMKQPRDSGQIMSMSHVDNTIHVQTRIEGTADYDIHEFGLVMNDGTADVLLTIQSSATAVASVRHGQSLYITFLITLDAGSIDAIDFTVVDQDPRLAQWLDDSDHEHNAGLPFATQFAKNVEIVEKVSGEAHLAMLEMWRANGQSGVVNMRHYGQVGDLPWNYHNAAGFDSWLGTHNHPQYTGVAGFPEGHFVVNGNVIKTHHLDYGMYAPAAGDYLNMERIDPPAVPSAISSLPTVEAQTDEMREWLIAYHDHDTAHRPFDQHFDVCMSYVEVWHERLTGDTLQFFDSSFRHRYSSQSIEELLNQFMVQATAGNKSRLENTSWTPKIVSFVGTNGQPEFAIVRYRIGVVRLGTYAEYPVHRMVDEVDDPLLRLATDTRYTDFHPSRLGRYRLLRSIGADPEVAERYLGPSLLDELMSKVPGMDGAGASLTAVYHDLDNSNNLEVNTEIDPDTRLPLNAAYYSRLYGYDQPGAAGRSKYLRGWADPYCFTARTSHPEVVALPGMGGGHRITSAIPLELIVRTPLESWNPYNVAYKAKSAITGNGQTTGTAYNGWTEDGVNYRCPTELYSPDQPAPDPADTVFFRWVKTPAHGTVTLRPSGMTIHSATLPGGQVCRYRYPIAPVHQEGSHTYRMMEAHMRETMATLTALTEHAAVTALDHLKEH